MIYRYRITLPGIKGFFRVYKVHSSNTLYTLHRQMMVDMEFAADQPILFKALDAEGNVIARYALVDLGFGTVDDVTIDGIIKQGCTSLMYFYDTKAKKYVTLTLEGEPEKCTAAFKPEIVDAKGPNPVDFDNGYVAFEDLPQEHRRIPSLGDSDPDEEDEDDDEEVEEEDASDEDGKEIYDENE